MTITVAEAKKKAARLRERLAEMGNPLTSAQALEVYACAQGDASWAAMRARLSRTGETKPRAGRLGVYTCALYAATEEGERKFVAKRSVVCFSKKQAEEFMYELFPGMYEETGYARPSYSTEFVDTLNDNTQPMLDEVANWLSGLMQRWNGDAIRLSFWDLMTSHGGTPVNIDKTDATVIREAIVRASPTFKTAKDFYLALYRALSGGLWFASEDENVFGIIDDDLQWGLGFSKAVH